MVAVVMNVEFDSGGGRSKGIFDVSAGANGDLISRDGACEC